MTDQDGEIYAENGPQRKTGFMRRKPAPVGPHSNGDQQKLRIPSVVGNGAAQLAILVELVDAEDQPLLSDGRDVTFSVLGDLKRSRFPRKLGSQWHLWNLH